jgi:hypothetical protein
MTEIESGADTPREQNLATPRDGYAGPRSG